MTRHELMARMSVSEFYEAMLLEQLEPFGERGEYYRAGMICATIANVQRDPKKRATPYTPEDFFPMLKAEQVAPRQSADAIAEAFLAFKESYNKQNGYA